MLSLSEMIFDRQVVGILDTFLSEDLQMEADLTLEEVKQIVRQHKAVQKQQTYSPSQRTAI